MGVVEEINEMFSLRAGSRCVRLVVLGVILCVPGLVGCGGSKKASVSGKITYKGEPLGNGTVVFIGEKSAGGSSPIGADGSYKMRDVPVGPMKITVETVPSRPAPKTPNMPKAPNMPEMPPMPGQENAAPGKYVKIPDRFKDPAKSGLTYDVTPGDQKHDITLPD